MTLKSSLQLFYFIYPPFKNIARVTILARDFSPKTAYGFILTDAAVKCWIGSSNGTASSWADSFIL